MQMAQAYKKHEYIGGLAFTLKQALLYSKAMHHQYSLYYKLKVIITHYFQLIKFFWGILGHIVQTLTKLNKFL